MGAGARSNRWKRERVTLTNQAATKSTASCDYGLHRLG
jgi:hypothetical protein